MHKENTNRFYTSNLIHRISKDADKLNIPVKTELQQFAEEVIKLPLNIIDDYQDLRMSFTYEKGIISLNFASKNKREAINFIKQNKIYSIFKDKNNYDWKIQIHLV